VNPRPPASWPVLRRVAALLAANPDRNGRSDVRRLSDVVRNALYAERRGVGVGAEDWIACCFFHATLKEARGSDPVGALWWSLTRARNVQELEEGVSPDLSKLEAAVERIKNPPRIPAAVNLADLEALFARPKE
jgi:hypothetical protein